MRLHNIDMLDAAAQLYSAIPPELKAILVQQLLNSSVAAVLWGWRRWWYALCRINRQDVLYKQYLNQFVSHFSTIATPMHLVPFTGSLDADKFLLWPELDEEIRSKTAERPEPGRESSLPRKLKATGLLTHPLSNNRLFVVEGEAGVGKTTMARALARLAAKQALELMERKDEDGPQVQYLPLYFNAEDLIKLAEDTPVGQINPSGESALKDLLNAVLQKSNRALLVIVDGLDEVGESVQTKALQRLRSLWIEEGNHRYLVLGRPGSVRGIPWIQGDEGVLKLALRPWGEAEVREFLERWSGEKKESLLNGDEVDGLIGYIRDHVGLPTPALMVQMVVARYLELRESNPDDVLAQMPETRSKLYQNYLRQLLRHSEDAKPGPAQGGTAQTADQQKRLWLGCLELLLKQDPGLRQRVRNTCSVSDLPDVGRASISDHPCRALVSDSVEAEKWWEERKLCRLGHESLHEFLAAESLIELYQDNQEELWEKWIKPKFFDPYWQQTLIFTLEMMGISEEAALKKLAREGESEEIRYRAVQRLSKLGFRDSLYELAAGAENEEVRFAAASELVKFDMGEALGMLKDLVENADSNDVRNFSLNAIVEVIRDFASKRDKKACDIALWVQESLASVDDVVERSRIPAEMSSVIAHICPHTAIKIADEIRSEVDGIVDRDSIFEDIAKSIANEHPLMAIKAAQKIDDQLWKAETYKNISRILTAMDIKDALEIANKILMSTKDINDPLQKKEIFIETIRSLVGRDSSRALSAKSWIIEVVESMKELPEKDDYLMETTAIIRPIDAELAIEIARHIKTPHLLVEALEKIGAEAKPTLEHLAIGAGDEAVRVEAMSALERMNTP